MRHHLEPLCPFSLDMRTKVRTVGEPFAAWQLRYDLATAAAGNNPVLILLPSSISDPPSAKGDKVKQPSKADLLALLELENHNVEARGVEGGGVSVVEGVRSGGSSASSFAGSARDLESRSGESQKGV